MQQPIDPSRGLLPRYGVDRGVDLQVLPGGQEVVQRRVLGQHAGEAAYLVPVGEGVQAGDADLAAVGGEQPVDHPEQGGLARTVVAEEADDLALLDIQRERVDGDQVTETAGDRLQFDRGHLRIPGSR